jgi:hypothetical protein
MLEKLGCRPFESTYQLLNRNQLSVKMRADILYNLGFKSAAFSLYLEIIDKLKPWENTRFLHLYVRTATSDNSATFKATLFSQQGYIYHLMTGFLSSMRDQQSEAIPFYRRGIELLTQEFDLRSAPGNLSMPTLVYLTSAEQIETLNEADTIVDEFLEKSGWDESVFLDALEWCKERLQHGIPDIKPGFLGLNVQDQEYAERISLFVLLVHKFIANGPPEWAYDLEQLELPAIDVLHTMASVVARESTEILNDEDVGLWFLVEYYVLNGYEGRGRLRSSGTIQQIEQWLEDILPLDEVDSRTPQMAGDSSLEGLLDCFMKLSIDIRLSF